MTNINPFVKKNGICRTLNAGFLRSFSLVLVLLPLLFALTAHGEISAELLKAAKADNTAEVERLLKRGAVVNAKHKQYDQTALTSAAEWGHLTVVNILKQAGARQ